MNVKELMMTVRHEQEQDSAQMVDWWKSLDDSARIKLWLTIQQTFQDPYMEAMSRLAQVQFVSLALEYDGDSGNAGR